MSATPFRSHLLQQWARNQQGRPPAAVVPWLKASGHGSHRRNATLQSSTTNPEDETPVSFSASSSSGGAGIRSASGDYRDTARPTIHSSSRGSAPGSPGAIPPSLSSVDSAFEAGASSALASAASSSSPLWGRPSPGLTIRAAPRSSPLVAPPDCFADHRGLSRFFASAASTSSGSSSAPSTLENTLVGSGDFPPEDAAAALQSLLKSRRTATRLEWATGSSDDDDRRREGLLPAALFRAVECAGMAPNHKRTEAFSFRRFLGGSRTARELAGIAYEVTLQKTGSPPNAESKRQKWLRIPAFLVALVHENQTPPQPRPSNEPTPEEADSDDDANESLFPADYYQPLPYSPPQTELQLEDYAACCAAVQNVLLSLHAEGIGSKWATGPVVATPAFRELVRAHPTDRVAALVMVGGDTEFSSEKEAHLTRVRRQRRRPVSGDLITDLP